MNHGPKDEQNEETEVFDVIELESDDGETESFVIMDTVEIQGNEYAILMLLSDLEMVESMSEDEFKDLYGEEPCFHLMRKDGEFYEEVLDEEYDQIKDELDQILAKMSQ